MKCCNGDCNQGRDCEDQPVVTFDEVVGFIRNLMAGIGLLACVVALWFWSGK